MRVQKGIMGKFSSALFASDALCPISDSQQRNFTSSLAYGSGETFVSEGKSMRASEKSS